jgi:hypothetical protein
VGSDPEDRRRRATADQRLLLCGGVGRVAEQPGSGYEWSTHSTPSRTS